MKSAFRNALPAIFCYFPLGVVYGALCVQNSFPWYFALLSSAFVYAGAIQFLGLTLLAAGGSPLTLLLSIIPLGIRNIFYGMTMVERFKDCSPLHRAYLAHGLVDATYSILVTAPPLEDEKEDLCYTTYLTLIIQLSWILGTLLGLVTDQLFTLPPGLEFSLTAFFAASAVEQIRKKREIKPVLVALASLALAGAFAPNHLLLVGMALSSLAILALPTKSARAA